MCEKHKKETIPKIEVTRGFVYVHVHVYSLGLSDYIDFAINHDSLMSPRVYCACAYCEQPHVTIDVLENGVQ